MTSHLLEFCKINVSSLLIFSCFLFSNFARQIHRKQDFFFHRDATKVESLQIANYNFKSDIQLVKPPVGADRCEKAVSYVSASLFRQLVHTSA